MKKLIYILFVSFLILGCSGDDTEVSGQDDIIFDWANHIPFTTSYQTFNMPFTGNYEPIPEEPGTVALSEASGLAISIKNPGMIWAHNDSGHTNTLYLINTEDAAIIAQYRILGTVNIDWEDMEITIDAESGEPYIYVGDIGDNSESRPVYSIYRFKEPVYSIEHSQQSFVSWEPEDFSRIRFGYPDGSHDAETLFVDPLTKDIFLVTKRGVVSTLYVAPYPQDTNNAITLFKAGEFSFRNASAGSVSLDGEKVVIKNRQEIFYWERQQGESMVQMLERTPVKAPYVGEPQGEAICFDQDYNYYTLSEELNNTTPPILFKYKYIN